MVIRAERYDGNIRRPIVDGHRVQCGRNPPHLYKMVRSRYGSIFSAYETRLALLRTGIAPSDGLLYAGQPNLLYREFSDYVETPLQIGQFEVRQPLLQLSPS